MPSSHYVPWQQFHTAHPHQNWNQWYNTMGPNYVGWNIWHYTHPYQTWNQWQQPFSGPFYN